MSEQDPGDLLRMIRASLTDSPADALRLSRQLTEHDDPVIRAEALLLAGQAARSDGQPDLAESLLEDAACFAAAAGELGTASQALLSLGKTLRSAGRFDDAFSRLADAERFADQAELPELVVDSLNLQASIINAQGHHQRALDMLNRAQRKAVLNGMDSLKVAMIGTNIGEIHRLLGNHPEALENLKSAYDRFKDAAANNRASNSNLISLGILYKRMGKLEEARRFYEEARESAQAIGDNYVVAAALNNLADMALMRNETEQAARLFSEALDMSVQAGSLNFQVDNLDGLGKVHLARNDMVAATDALSRALEIARRLGYRDGELHASMNLATAQLAMGAAEDAIGTLQRLLELAEANGEREHVISAHDLLSRAFEAVGDHRLALHHARRFHEEENVVYNERNEEKTRQLTIQFELERSNHQAEIYRMKSRYLQQAHEEAEALVLARTQELERAQLEIVTRLAIAAEFRDDETGMHTRRVGRNAAAIAYAMGFPLADLQVLFTAARLHDVGKIGIPDSVLLKQGRLAADEMELMKRHTVIGARILSAGDSRLLNLAETISLAHHERFDGQGYPSGLAGEAIPMAARIVAVSDVLDALTHERPYKTAWPVDEALSEIASQRGRQFDPDAVDACLAVFSGPDGLSPTDDTPAWQQLQEALRRLGASRGFPAVQRASVW